MFIIMFSPKICSVAPIGIYEPIFRKTNCQSENIIRVRKLYWVTLILFYMKTTKFIISNIVSSCVKMTYLISWFSVAVCDAENGEYDSLLCLLRTLLSSGSD